jgi:Domain of unknown function (DUF1772)
MTVLLSTVTLLALGIVTGIYLTGLIHDHRIDDLSATQYVAMHQMRDRTFRLVMPWIALSNLALVVGFSLGAAQPGLAQGLAFAAAAVLLIDIAFTVRRQLPVNQTIQRWTPATIPPNWDAYRDTWAWQHNVRVTLCFLADSLVLAALWIG